jgi:hypothetical protein
MRCFVGSRLVEVQWSSEFRVCAGIMFYNFRVRDNMMFCESRAGENEMA